MRKKDYSNYRKKWRAEDNESFIEDWTDYSISIEKILRKYKRPYSALAHRARKLGLGKRHQHTEYLTVGDICREMGVNKQTVIASWINRYGLEHKRSKTAHKDILILQEDLLNFLENHQDSFDASKVSDYLFAEEPDWLKKKRTKDTQWYPSRNNEAWTLYEDAKLERMFKKGCSDTEIGIELYREPNFIKYRRYQLNLNRHIWNDYELKILKEHSATTSIPELAKMLPLRTEKGIALKALKLGLEYHWSKDMCRNK